MIVVTPRANSFEDQMLVEAHSEFLMERVSALENKLVRVVTQMERLVEVMYKQAQASSTGHELVEALFTTLAESGVLDMEEMRKHWRPPSSLTEEAKEREMELLESDAQDALTRENEQFETGQAKAGRKN